MDLSWRLELEKELKFLPLLAVLQLIVYSWLSSILSSKILLCKKDFIQKETPKHLWVGD